MSQQGRNKLGKFSAKSDTNRQVRSIRLTDVTWNKLGDLADERSITRADLLEYWMDSEYFELQNSKNNSVLLSADTLNNLDKTANQRSITREELIIDLLNNFNSSDSIIEIEPLNNSALAKRLGIDPSNLSKQRAKGGDKLTIYTASKDPDGLPWRYSEVDKLYYPA